VDRMYREWVAAGSKGDFLDYLQQHYAPIGAKNDPKNLNRNWGPNVRAYLKAHPAAPTAAAPAAAAPKVYTDADYKAMAANMLEGIRAGLSYKAYHNRFVPQNAGVDEKRMKRIWDAIVAQLAEARKAQQPSWQNPPMGSPGGRTVPPEVAAIGKQVWEWIQTIGRKAAEPNIDLTNLPTK